MNIQEVALKYKDVMTFVIAPLAFLISMVSLGVSLRTAFLDRVNLKINARVIREPFYNQIDRIEITVLNIGRRSAVLEGVLCHYDNGETRYDYEKNGIEIREKERRVFQVDRSQYIISVGEGDVAELIDITVLDIERKQTKIKHSKELVKKLSNGHDFNS
ncbi:hypothetical protein [Scandinavium lactucae]|uniref:Uncharacterized protein n=1 Tax=Scandinavium lactucae TaxID=3095028 RepID=A0ABU4QU44_9ENTR|nr:MULTISPECIES: hypothetical protein [unclassified Scandinavium]MDX6042815.1 hypothetical protein [Scandinavium sp. V105_6]MDX6052816.1 hypothetical protein [Scandinavium sp. V105_1]